MTVRHKRIPADRPTRNRHLIERTAVCHPDFSFGFRQTDLSPTPVELADA